MGFLGPNPPDGVNIISRTTKSVAFGLLGPSSGNYTDFRYQIEDGDRITLPPNTDGNITHLSAGFSYTVNFYTHLVNASGADLFSKPLTISITTGMYMHH